MAIQTDIERQELRRESERPPRQVLRYGYTVIAMFILVAVIAYLMVRLFMTTPVR